MDKVVERSGRARLRCSEQRERIATYMKSLTAALALSMVIDDLSVGKVVCVG